MHRNGLAAWAALLTGTLVGTLIGCSPGGAGQTVPVAATASAPSSGEASASAPDEEVSVDRDDALAKALKPLLPDGDARVSVAVAALDGATDGAVYDGTSAFDTASIVKVDILAALLLRAQDAGRALTPQERVYATAMIENSDNASATALWEAIGGADGLDAANLTLGLTGTRAGAGGEWGLTQTTAEDQLTLLRAVFGTESAEDAEGAESADSGLSEASRAYVAGLMERIASDQRWGVSAAADSASVCALKNGWLPRSATGLWDINSVGRVSVGGKRYLVSVLSDGNTTKEAGVALVEGAAKAAVAVLTG
ncbi:class A beta-lactamase-related serine hydrolase [Streptomyces sp. NBC_01474]|uniref:serine hydrolase n=1 Tax=unclassified Streptomyces TaxID=2593676 RepID=UPI002DD962BC|nr:MULTISPECIES: serine hydrolase [unclassified Streptomyces]WSD99317.1 class A beta-lactamase-related serine hydrolase [Streptomyces sp. NBC_01474]